MNDKSKELREKLADMFIKSLEEDGLNWKRGWSNTDRYPRNGTTNKRYKGINTFILFFKQKEEGWTDPRWLTFKQIEKAGYHLTKGSKGTQIEYWMPWDKVNHKALSWTEYRNRIKDGANILDFAVYPKIYTVFNGAQIEGIPPEETYCNPDVRADAIISDLSRGMDVRIVHDDETRAYYNPIGDYIHLPPETKFYSTEEYNATALHELAHSTGAAHRLNREGITTSSAFGSEKYAREELVAELTSAFMSGHTGIDVTESALIDNHKAYIQSWIADIKEEPDVLIKAIKQADEACSYMEKAIGLDIEQDASLDKNEGYDM